MTYDDKVQGLADAIRRYIPFDNMAQARSYCDSHRTPQDSKVNTEICNMARQLLLHAGRECPTVAAILADIGTGNSADLVRCSALRDAIRQCARDYVSRRTPRSAHEPVLTGAVAN